MKIRGVQGGRDRGNVIELEPADKVLPALKVAVATHGEWDNYAVSVDDVKTSFFDYRTNGALIKKRFANNSYRAIGEASFYFRDKAKDKVMAPRKLQFKLVFEDTTDDMGLPDLKVTEFGLLG